MRTHIRYQLIAVILSILSILLLPGTSAGQEPGADIGVSKLGSPDQVNPGSDITYEITVTNGGPDPAENANLSDTLPPTLTFVSLSAPAGWACSTPAQGAGGTVTCTHPSLAITTGDVFTLVVNVPTDASPGTFFSNTATVSTTTFDPNDENNSASTASLVVGNSADIAVTKTASSDQVAAGFPLTYTIQVSNSGPDSADNVTLNDVLPAEVFFLSLSQPAGWNCMTPAVGAGGTVNCTRPSLAVTSGDIFTLVVGVRSDTAVDTVVTTTATVSTSTAESTDENNSDTASATVVAADPTAANGKVSGRILDDHGNPVSGAVIRLNGTDSRKTITDSNGNYHFDNVETNGFYTVTPSRVNYNFSPFNQSFSQLGNQTEAAFGATATGGNANPLDTPEYFVRQHYLDFLGREPDEAGFNFWSDQILLCGNDTDCVDRRMTNVSAAYFLSIEFQETGGLVDGLYRVSYGRRPSYGEFKPDAGAIAQDVVVGNQGWEGTLESNKAAFIEAFVQRPAFQAAFDRLSNDTYVDALIANTGVSFTASERERLVSGLGGGGMTRASVLRAIVENGQVVAAKRNEAFVLMEYFGYLRREPDAGGYQFWLNKLNEFNGNFEQAEMVKSFIISGEYRERFPR